MIETYYFIPSFQVNEDSGNRRPVMLEVVSTSAPFPADQSKQPSEANNTSAVPEQTKTAEKQSTG